METSGALIGLALGLLIGALISGAVIWLVSKMKIGLTVDNFGWAMLAGVLIGLLSNIILYVLPTLGEGAIGFVLHLVVSAVAILLGGKILKGLKVEGFKGALLAALAIAAIVFLVNLLASGVATA